jgi:hypothetical protein
VNNLVYLLFLSLRELGKKLKKFPERNLFHIIIITKKNILLNLLKELLLKNRERNKLLILLNEDALTVENMGIMLTNVLSHPEN